VAAAGPAVQGTPANVNGDWVGGYTNPSAAQIAAPAGTAGAGGGGILSSVESAAGKYWPVLAGAGILGYEALNGNKTLPAQGQLQSLAGQNASTGAALESYEQTGLLPPGLQLAVNSQSEAAAAQIRSSYAGMGLSGSTSEAQALAGVKQQTAATIGKIASDLATQGIQLSSLSSQELTQLMQTEQQQQSDLNKALASFAAGLAGSGLKATA
jgi:hypothetical protein